jgi:hypothetical protein
VSLPVFHACNLNTEATRDTGLSFDTLARANFLDLSNRQSLAWDIDGSMLAAIKLVFSIRFPGEVTRMYASIMSTPTRMRRLMPRRWRRPVDKRAHHSMGVLHFSVGRPKLPVSLCNPRKRPD